MKKSSPKKGQRVFRGLAFDYVFTMRIIGPARRKIIKQIIIGQIIDLYGTGFNRLNGFSAKKTKNSTCNMVFPQNITSKEPKARRFPQRRRDRLNTL
jgi:hypothetical protein